MARRRARTRRRGGAGRRGWRSALVAVLAVPLLYLAVALVGSLVPVNRGWSEPAAGTTVYLRGNGVHVDVLMPAVAQGLDWRPSFPAGDFADPPLAPRWFAFGAGERRVYLDTPTWADITPRTIWSGLTGGERVIHVERVGDPGPELRAIRLRPEEYRRLFAAIRAQLALDPAARPQRIDHPGYGPDDAFYRGTGRASAIATCNVWIADQLRIAGVKTSAWSPFSAGLLWRYRAVAGVAPGPS
jgi:uncharacterized protein (TIGR02117 family)